MSDIVERLEAVGCNRDPFTTDHADCICRLTHEAAAEVKQLRDLLFAYVADENRFNRGQGEPYGSISTETGILARAAVKGK